MSPTCRSRPSGFTLIEALVALVIIGLGLLGIAKLQTFSLAGSGESRSRTEAANIAQQKLEELRNVLRRSDLTTMANGSASVTGSNATYALAWTVSTPNAGLEQRLIQLSATWTDARGLTQRLDMNSLVAWDDPHLQVSLNKDHTGSLISPTGAAQRGEGKVPDGLTPVSTNHDGTKIFVDQGKTYLTRPDGTILLYLTPKTDGTPQSFTRITGRIYLDQKDKSSVPDPVNVKVRLSSEGECIYNNADNGLTVVNTGSHSYKYFTYTCYVGPGWYGNVGVTVVEINGGQVGNSNVCVGDPGFNNGLSNNTTTSAHSALSTIRSYRGFRLAGGVFLSTGMGDGGRYGLTLASDGTPEVGPFNGWPRPSDYPSYYSVAAESAYDYFNQDFLITAKLTGQDQCRDRMDAGQFKRNAGRNACISPDGVADYTDECSNNAVAVWPNFEAPANAETCSNSIYGAMADPAGKVEQAEPLDPKYGTCIQPDKKIANYQCNFVAPKGSKVRLRNFNVGKNPYDLLSGELVLNCGEYPGSVNFQQ